MPVLSVSVPSRESARLSCKALVHGVESDVIDHDGGVTYIDLIGSEDKINTVARASYVTIIEQNDTVPHDEPVYTMIGRNFQ